MMKESLINQFDDLAKSQKVRLFDIYALGPVMIYAATRKKPLGNWTRRALFVSGIMTIVYNWHKYRTIEKDLKANVSKLTEGRRDLF